MKKAGWSNRPNPEDQKNKKTDDQKNDPKTKKGKNIIPKSSVLNLPYTCPKRDSNVGHVRFNSSFIYLTIIRSSVFIYSVIQFRSNDPASKNDVDSYKKCLRLIASMHKA